MTDELTNPRSTPRRRWLRRIGITLLVVALGLAAFWCILAWKYYGHDVNITRNYAAELNAPILKVPEEQLAWTHYRRALMELEPRNEQERAADPRDPAWPQTIAYLKRNAKAIAMARDAAKLPTLGFLVQDGDSPDDLDRQTRQHGVLLGQDPEPNLSDSPPLMLCHVVPLFGIGALPDLLIADAQLAATESDGARVVDDWIALLQISDQFQGPPSFAIGYLFAQNYRSSVFDSIATILASQPSSFSEAHLQKLAQFLARKSEIRNQPIDFTAERAFHDDYIQRVFTDDGKGGGYWSPDALNIELESGLLKEMRRIEDRGWKIADPIRFVLYYANRREVVDLDDRLFRRLESAAALPLWRWDELTSAPVAELETGGDKFAASTFFDRNMLFDIVFRQHALATYEAATSVIIALHRYHHLHARWPQNLEQLVPGLLAKLPRDCFDGRNLRYSMNLGEPRLYSVGPDSHDDHGDASSAADEHVVLSGLHTSAKGDWVFWPPRLREVETGESNEPPRAPEPDDDAGGNPTKDAGESN
jgi:hypothetical protein